MPPEARNVALGERFGKTPLEIEDGDADRWLRYLHVLGVEARVHMAAYGLGPDEPLPDEGRRRRGRVTVAPGSLS